MGQPALKMVSRGKAPRSGQEKAKPVEEPKTLRVGLIEGGRIIEEHVAARRANVSVGDSERNTFAIPTAVLPSRFDLFERQGDGYRLVFTDEMKGRLSTNGHTEDLEDLKKTGRATRKGRSWRVDLPETARGRVVIGDYTFLFQFVVPPPAQPRPQLPASVKRRWAKSIDWPFAAILLVSAVAQVGLITALVVHDWPAVHGFQPVPDRIRYILAQAPPSQQDIERLQKTLSPNEDQPQAEGVGDAPAESPQPTTARRPSTASSPGQSPEARAQQAAERQARLRNGLKAAARAQILTALNGTGPAFDDVLRGGSPDTDFDALMNQVEGVEIARAGTGTILRRPSGGDGQSSVASIEGLRRQLRTGNVTSGDVGEETTPRGRVGTQDPRPGPSKGFLSGDEVRSVVRQRLGGIKACYERALPRNPTLGGRLVISFTVGGGGRVVAARTSQSTLGPGSDQVSSCVERQFRSMRFSEPRGGNASFTFPFVFRPMQ